LRYGANADDVIDADMTERTGDDQRRLNTDMKGISTIRDLPVLQKFILGLFIPGWALADGGNRFVRLAEKRRRCEVEKLGRKA
jgi:hypothetical protein